MVKIFQLQSLKKQFGKNKRMRQFIFFLLFVDVSFAQQIPQVVSGKIHRFMVQSQYTESRNVDVWTPENYSPTQKYDVLYMHDGQMLFDSTITWNHLAWDVDDVVSKMLASNQVKPVIVVGIWSSATNRHTDYFPQKPYETLTLKEQEMVTSNLLQNGRIEGKFTPNSDRYLRFLVQEVKPLIDSTFSVYKDASHTFIAGSSMGGLISMYALCEYPTVFGGAACLSTHWPGIFSLENNPIPEAFLNYLDLNLPSLKNHRIYFDCGDQTLDALYPPLQQAVDKRMKTKRYAKKQWLTSYFPGANHSEVAWKKRLQIPLTFLLKPN
jgi:enterochelin esterase-like enzyme